MTNPRDNMIGPPLPPAWSPSEIESLRATIERCGLHIRDAERALHEQWLERAGAYAAAMMNDREQANQLLDHADPLVRMAAMEAFVYCWPLDQPVAARIAAVLQENVDEEVKRVAIHVLEKGVTRDQLIHLTSLFVAVVSDASQSAALRCDGYNMLANIAAHAELEDIAAHVDVNRLMSFAGPTRNAERIEDIDWDLVHSFREAR